MSDEPNTDELVVKMSDSKPGRFVESLDSQRCPKCGASEIEKRAHYDWRGVWVVSTYRCSECGECLDYH